MCARYGGILDTCDGDEGRVSGRCMGRSGDDALNSMGDQRCVGGLDAGGIGTGVAFSAICLFGGANGALAGIVRFELLVPGWTYTG